MTLVEVMVSASISSFILIGIISSFLFMARSGANLVNYADMENEARIALEEFAQDARQASDLAWNSTNSVTLTVSGAAITYTYSSGSFARTVGAGTSATLIEGISNFAFSGYMITGASIDLSDLSTAPKRAAASSVTKQVQIYLKASRTSATVTSATNTVLSARFILRNKRVST